MTIDIRRILVPIDFSEHAEYVIEWASAPGGRARAAT